MLSGSFVPAKADTFEEYSRYIEERTGKPALPGLKSAPNPKVISSLRLYEPFIPSADGGAKNEVESIAPSRS